VPRATPQEREQARQQKTLLEALEAAGAPSDDAGNIGYAGDPATAEQIEAMFGHLQAGLAAIGFLDPENPRKLMPRLRRLFARTGLEREEVNILRGIAKRMLLASETRNEGNKEG